MKGRGLPPPPSASRGQEDPQGGERWCASSYVATYRCVDDISNALEGCGLKASHWMASIKIRHLDDRLMRALRVHAARHGRSMEAEARQILNTALDDDAAEPTKLFEASGSRIAQLGCGHFYVPR